VSSRSDEALLLAARRDADAFAELYRRHARPLAGFLFDPARGDAVGWLYGIARHQLGRRARHGSVEERARRRLGMERLELTDSDLRAIEACDDATVALQSLPPEQRDAITARVIAEQDYAAIADAAGGRARRSPAAGGSSTHSAQPAAQPGDALAPVVPARTTVAILNGSRKPGLARDAATTLERHGWRIGTVTNAPGSRLDSSCVDFTPGHSQAASIIATQLGISTIIPPNPEYLAAAGPGADVIVVLGTTRAGP
jgi:hypothetical protein